MKLKSITSLIIAFNLCSFLSVSHATELNWLTDIKEAQKQARQENKKILIDFTGSDWCGWCMKLDKEVFSTPEFADYATQNFVLLKVDFPHNTPQDSKQKAANEKVAQQYGPNGFPTIVLLKSSGRVIGKIVDYQSGGPTAYIAKLEALK
jgi:protein disulfide-isomerase